MLSQHNKRNLLTGIQNKGHIVRLPAPSHQPNIHRPLIDLLTK